MNEWTNEWMKTCYWRLQNLGWGHLPKKLPVWPRLHPGWQRRNVPSQSRCDGSTHRTKAQPKNKTMICIIWIWLRDCISFNYKLKLAVTGWKMFHSFSIALLSTAVRISISHGDSVAYIDRVRLNHQTCRKPWVFAIWD